MLPSPSTPPVVNVPLFTASVNLHTHGTIISANMNGPLGYPLFMEVTKLQPDNGTELTATQETQSGPEKQGHCCSQARAAVWIAAELACMLHFVIFLYLVSMLCGVCLQREGASYWGFFYCVYLHLIVTEMHAACKNPAMRTGTIRSSAGSGL